MESALNWFEKWMLRHIVGKIIYNRKMKTLFKLVVNEHMKFYYEDNIPMAVDFIKEKLLGAEEEVTEKAQKKYQISKLQTKIKECKFSSEVEISRLQREIDSLKSEKIKSKI